MKSGNSKPTFAEFWPYYLAEHSRAATQQLHLLGTFAGLALLAAALWMQSWRLLLLGFVAGYGINWFSHFFVEHNRPATFKYPWLSFQADFKMAFYLLTGQIEKELARLKIHPKP
ncbi:MAG: DUF962 domain-containing protein [Acidobacteria bacterium]|nr:DUF962 domain-containing protein [Acidobacteriota bacterium]